jgi:hypothetical protein
VTDGKSVFVFFADFGLVAYDFEGKLRWQLPLGPFNSQHGLVASPVYADGRVILVCDQDTDAYIIAVAGVSQTLFDDTARRALYRATKGIPRKVNKLAMTALRVAAARKAAVVNEAILLDATTEALL